MQMSRKLFVCLSLSLLALLWAHPAYAQRFRWWKDEKFTRELALTPDQCTRIEAVFQAAQPALRAQQRALAGMLQAVYGGDDRVRHVDLGGVVDLADRRLAFDGMHLTPPGNARIADALVGPTLELLE